MHLQEHNVYVWLSGSWIYSSNMNKQHKYEFGITFSFIIVMAAKCQPGHNLHPINIFTSIIRLVLSLKYWVEEKQILVEILFSYLVLFLLALYEKGIRSQEVGKEINNPPGTEEEDRRRRRKKKGYLFFYLFEKGLCSLLSQ